MTLFLSGLPDAVPIAPVKLNMVSPEFSIFAELHGLVLKTVGLADVLRGALLPFQGAITLAAVYGSQAAGTVSSGSDVDLLVVGTVEEMALHKAVAEAETRLARTVNYTLLTPREFARRRRERGGFVARPLAGPLIPLLAPPMARDALLHYGCIRGLRLTEDFR